MITKITDCFACLNVGVRIVVFQQLPSMTTGTVPTVQSLAQLPAQQQQVVYRRLLHDGNVQMYQLAATGGYMHVFVPTTATTQQGDERKEVEDQQRWEVPQGQQHPHSQVQNPQPLHQPQAALTQQFQVQHPTVHHQQQMAQQHVPVQQHAPQHSQQTGASVVPHHRHPPQLHQQQQLQPQSLLEKSLEVALPHVLRPPQQPPSSPHRAAVASTAAAPVLPDFGGDKEITAPPPSPLPHLPDHSESGDAKPGYVMRGQSVDPTAATDPSVRPPANLPQDPTHLPSNREETEPPQHAATTAKLFFVSSPGLKPQQQQWLLHQQPHVVSSPRQTCSLATAPTPSAFSRYHRRKLSLPPTPASVATPSVSVLESVSSISSGLFRRGSLPMISERELFSRFKSNASSFRPELSDIPHELLLGGGLDQQHPSPVVIDLHIQQVYFKTAIILVTISSFFGGWQLLHTIHVFTTLPYLLGTSNLLDNSSDVTVATLFPFSFPSG